MASYHATCRAIVVVRNSPYPIHHVQAGTVSSDKINEAAVGIEGSILLAGKSNGTWIGADSAEDSEKDIVLFNTILLSSSST